MASHIAQKPLKTVSIRHLRWVGLITQLMIAAPLWSHTSDGGTILGRYSSHYALILGIHAVMTLGWLVLAIWRNQVERTLRRLPAAVIYSVILVTGVALARIWFTSAEDIVKQYLSLTWLTAASVLVRSLPDRPVRFEKWPLLFLLTSLLLLFPMYIGVLADRHFKPDEALWADRSVALFTDGGMYSRVTYRPPMLIEPGYGWENAGYGWLLHNVSFDLAVGRTWQFIANLVAFAGIGAVTARLYGWKTAFVAVALAILSRTFIPFLDYRPNYHIPAAAAFIMFSALQARYSRKQWAAGLWNLVCGLLATLSLQIHASGAILAVAFALYYVVEFLWKSYRQRQIADIRPIIAFGLGALVGTAIFYQFNLLPVGGLGPYLERLQTERGTFFGVLPGWQSLIIWPQLIERLLVWSGTLYLVWRHSKTDKLFMAIVAFILLASAGLDTQGYRQPLHAFFIISIAVLLVDGFGSTHFLRGQNRHSVLAAAAVIFVLILQMWGALLSNPGIWDWFRTGQLPPFLYKEIVPILEPYIRPDDTIVSTHQLVWSFPEANLISHAAAGHHIYGNIIVKNGPFESELAFWEDVSPTVIIFIENEMHFDPGLQEYMVLHEFQVCSEPEVMGHDIQIYRTTCS